MIANVDNSYYYDTDTTSNECIGTADGCSDYADYISVNLRDDWNREELYIEHEEQEEIEIEGRVVHQSHLTAFNYAVPAPDV